MQDKMQEKILETLINYLQNTENFVLEQMPEILSQTLNYEKISSIIGLSISIPLIAVAIFIGYYFFTNPTLDSYGTRSTGSVMGTIRPSALSFLLFIQICFYFDKLVRIYLAPKYFLIKLFVDMK